MSESKEQILARMLRDLDTLYDNADDNGERGAVAHVEDVVLGLYECEIKKREEA
ncbi:MAG: hypothetical protein GY764_11355 [Halieaceae bacterium]|nr:hypothetical protein [Halieaceae bacterium]